MPTLPSPGKVLRLDFESSLGSNTSVRDHLFFQYTGSVSPADLTTLCNTAATVWGTQISPNQSNQFTLLGILGTDLSSASGAQVLVATSKPGSSPGAFVPAASCIVIRFKIARRFRGGHPRFYLGGLLASQISNAETLNGTAAAGYVTSFQNLVSGIETTPPAGIGSLTHVSVSYYAGFTNRTLPSGRVIQVPTLRGTPVVDPVISYSNNPRVGSQRRRNQN